MLWGGRGEGRGNELQKGPFRNYLSYIHPYQLLQLRQLSRTAKKI